MKLLTVLGLLTFCAWAETPVVTPATEQAIANTKKWANTSSEPLSTADGRVIYAYGPSLPTVVCAPLKLCLIELQPGEKIASEENVRIGDSKRWSVTPSTYGSGEEATTVLIIKPMVDGELDTSFVVTTDRRIYYLRLVSRQQDYMARVAFQYGDEDTKKWALFAARQRVQERERQTQAEILPAMITAEGLNFNYTITGTGHFRPTRVYDDGAKTFIVMPPDLRHRPAPTLEILDSEGKTEMTNYRVKADTYIVDRLIDRAQLVSGVGKKAQKVEIARVAQPE